MPSSLRCRAATASTAHSTFLSFRFSIYASSVWSSQTHYSCGTFILIMAIPVGNLFVFITALFIVLFANVYLSHGLYRCHDRESETLFLFRESLNSSHLHGFDILSSWVKGTDCCTWYGVECDMHTNRVVKLYLGSGSSGFDPGSEGSGSFLLAGVISDGLCNLSFLTFLDLTANEFTGTIPLCLGNLLHLQHLLLGKNQLSGEIPYSLGNISSLLELDISYNKLSGPIPYSFGSLISLHSLDVSSNQLSGPIPYSFGNLISLHSLDVSSNKLSGPIPYSFVNLTSLQSLDVYVNQLSGAIPSWIGGISSLGELLLSNNQLSGQIPNSLGNLTALRVLDIGFARSLNQTISDALRVLDIGFARSLNQTISDALLQNLTKLMFLSMFHCVLNISTTWIPPFQLKELHLILCNINGPIPPWISTQFSLEYLTMVNGNLVGEIPPWLWDNSCLLRLNLSGNHLQGSISGVSTSITFDILDLSKNALSGSLPSLWPSNMGALVLNDNLFFGKIPSSLGRMQLEVLNLENNNLTGIIPSGLVMDCSGFQCYYFQVLNLANNSLEGGIPKDICKHSNALYSLVLGNNKLSGLLPNSIANCRELQVLDIGNNFIEGQIPKSIGKLSKLRVLMMNGNHFTGIIPGEIGHLKRLQILDVSFNHLSGFIPQSIVSLDAMVVPNEVGYKLHPPKAGIYYAGYGQISYRDELDMIAKGLDQHYPYILSTLVVIDLSHNQLSGDIPSNFGKLKGLRFLNLSMNNLSGIIPLSLGEMGQLESLDLSINRFSGKIPEELRSLSALGVLNLSNNNLSGRIPQEGQMATFKESSFLNNPGLWGCPLPKNCSWPEFVPPSSPIQEEKKEKESKEIPWFEIAVGLSYVTSFTIVMIWLLPKIM